ncbi:hypothetical protein [Peptoclostridium acidaminophilum]|uniref:hypothetical protein n=1 Tax=Peptoclostridium acidaminophilum TaxID=1731 RepID=UPI00046D4823|nr:hypothetical protein [Peptoclostridium acidaminophilum]
MNSITNVSINDIIQAIIELFAIGGIGYAIYVKVSKKRDSNKNRDINQNIVNGNNNNQAGRDINVKK